jgi:hypothetical protein
MSAAAAGGVASDDAAGLLAAFERALDPARPAAGSAAEVLGYGEISAVLALPALPGRVCKRLSGFHDDAAAARHAELVRDYVAELERAGVDVVETQLVPVRVPGRRPVVYLIQPRLDPARLGSRLLREADERVLLAAMDRVLAAVLRVWRANRARGDGRRLTVDAQLSNWHFTGGGEEPGEPVLVDVGTPFVRRGDADLLDAEIFLAAVPRFLRGHYRRARAVERYLDHYFSPRGLVLDLLGNFHKEGRPDRVGLAAERANRWLAEHAQELGASAPVSGEEVARAYAHDAEQLERFLRLRRVDRFVRTRLLRGRYDFILPGPIRR